MPHSCSSTLATWLDRRTDLHQALELARFPAKHLCFPSPTVFYKPNLALPACEIGIPFLSLGFAFRAAYQDFCADIGGWINWDSSWFHFYDDMAITLHRPLLPRYPRCLSCASHIRSNLVATSERPLTKVFFHVSPNERDHCQSRSSET